MGAEGLRRQASVTLPRVPNEGAVGYEAGRLLDHVTIEELVAIATDQQDRLPDPRQDRSGVERHLRLGLGQEIIRWLGRAIGGTDSDARAAAALPHRPAGRGAVTVNDPLRHPQVDLLAPRADLGGSGDNSGVRDTVGMAGRQIQRDFGMRTGHKTGTLLTHASYGPLREGQIEQAKEWGLSWRGLPSAHRVEPAGCWRRAGCRSGCSTAGI
jgi:hypothetical protein